MQASGTFQPSESAKSHCVNEALLAMAAATSWFTSQQLDDIDSWLNEVADCGEAEDWLQHFPEDDLRDVVLDKLRRQINGLGMSGGR